MRNQNKQWYLIRHLSIFAILFTIIITKSSCNKFDLSPNLLQQSKNYFVENFFTLKTPVNNDVYIIMQTLKNHQAKTDFVNQLPYQYGMPIWQKSVKQINNSYASKGDTTILNDGTIIVPFTITDSSISAILVAQPQGDTIKTFIYTKDHLYQAVHNDAFDRAFAESLLNLFLFMENKVYGKQQFYHIPNKYYSDSVQIGTDGKKIIQLKDESNDSSTNLIFVRTCYYVYVCGGQATSNWVAPKSNESNSAPACWTTVCTTVIIYPPPIPWPGGGGGTGGTGGGSPGGGTGNPNGGGTNCNDPFYSFSPCGPNNPPPSQEQLDLQWMNANVIDSTNDPCITSTIATLKLITPKLPRLIRDFFSANPSFKMKFETYVSTQPSCNGSAYCEPEGAFTDPVPVNNTYDIGINKYYANATDLSTAATIIHEALHAQLIQWLRQAVILQDTAAQHQLAALYGHVFTPDFNYNASVYNTALQLTTQHDAMVALYKNLVGDALYAFAQQKNISITYQNCQKLAWAGLNTTEAFNRLQISDKDDITERINAERDPNGTSVNSNGSGGTIRTAYGTPCY